jgi:multiple sugar transport system substrate-binding protein/putative aldouronate transport system substrate-binding protein
MTKDWAAKFGSPEPALWMKDNNALVISPNVRVSLPSDPNDTAVARNASEEVLEEYSWKMIFCGSQSKFDSLWDEMVAQMDGNGFADVVKFDAQKWQIELDAKNAAAKK